MKKGFFFKSLSCKAKEKKKTKKNNMKDRITSIIEYYDTTLIRSIL